MRDWPQGAAPGSTRKPGVVARLDADSDDRYDNLILLCEDHHNAARRAPGAWSTEHWARSKAEHEEWVRRSLLAEHSPGRSGRYDPRYQGITLLPRVRSGQGLAAILGGIHSIQYDRDQADKPGAREVADGFLRYIQGVTDLWKEYDATEKSRVARHLDGQIEALARRGWLLFAIRHTVEAGVAGAEWSILRIWMLREG